MNSFVNWLLIVEFVELKKILKWMKKNSVLVRQPITLVLVGIQLAKPVSFCITWLLMQQILII